MTRRTPNSAMTCRQAPHGIAGASPSATTTTVSMARCPSETALWIATRSAQWERG